MILKQRLLIILLMSICQMSYSQIGVGVHIGYVKNDLKPFPESLILSIDNKEHLIIGTKVYWKLSEQAQIKWKASYYKQSIENVELVSGFEIDPPLREFDMLYIENQFLLSIFPFDKRDEFFVTSGFGYKWLLDNEIGIDYVPEERNYFTGSILMGWKFKWFDLEVFYKETIGKFGNRFFSGGTSAESYGVSLSVDLIVPKQKKGNVGKLETEVNL